MSSTKGSIYSTTLDQARRLSLFTEAHPAGPTGKLATAQDANEKGMDWKELLRKFTKHNSSREVVAAAAQTDQIIHSLLARAASSSSYSASTSHALDNPGQALAWPPLIRPDDRPAALSSLTTLEAAIRNGTGNEIEKNSAAIVSAFGLYSVGEFDRALDELRKLDKTIPYSSSTLETYDLTLRVLANAVEGFSYERLGRETDAVSAYARTAKVYDDACSIIGSKSSPLVDNELHLVGESALYRLCMYTKGKSDPRVAYPHHRLYVRLASVISAAQKNSANRSTSSQLYPGGKSLLVHRNFRELMSQTGNYEDVGTSNGAQEATLRASTSLPKAGEVNRPYLMFLDEVADGWKKSGAGREGAAEVVEVMYNALTHTFQSHRLLRHLARALVALGQYDEAGKALRLYFELWNKSRETDAVQVAKDIRRLRGDSAPRLDDAEDDRNDPYANDFDSDRDFVTTLAWGTRLFCKYLDDPRFGLELATRAKEIFEEKKDQTLATDSVALSKIERALGVALGALTAKEANIETRPQQHAAALKHLETAAQLDPSSWETLYHLAYQLAELRQITPALERARQAAALNNSSKEVWHLLGLLVAAQKDLGAALQVIETSLDDDDEDDEEGQVNGGANGFVAKKFDSNLLDKGHNRFEFSSDDTQRLEVEMSIRMTRNVVIEAMEGPEAALLDQAQILAFFSSAFAQVRDVPELRHAAGSLSTDMNSGSIGSKKSSGLSKAKSIKAGANGRTDRESSVLSSLSATTSPATIQPSAATNPRATKILVDLWLMSAASYRRAGKLEDARGAIAEAEQLDADDADVWCQLALYHIARAELSAARACLVKALSFKADHVAAVILMARVYLADAATVPSTLSSTTDKEAILKSKLPFAEALLDTATKRFGWDVPEAWFELSKCYKGSARTQREKECLVWALQLEETRSVRSLSAVPRLL